MNSISLLARAASSNDEVALGALVSLCQQKSPAVTLALIESIEAQPGRDQRIYGWCYMLRLMLLPEKSTELLVAGLNHPNPRLREFCADFIGDHAIEGLREHLLPLMDDPVESVRQSASYNYHEMF